MTILKSTNTQNSTNPTTNKLPVNISLDRWADVGFNWQGQKSPTEFKRLAALLSTEHTPALFAIDVQLSKNSNVLLLDFAIKGEVWLTCQRCLQPIAIDLTGEHRIALLEDEVQAKMLDEDDEYLLLEEVIEDEEQENLLPLTRLIEDEILLKIPLSPKHDDCEMMLDQVGDIEEEEEESPFAALAALKGKL